MQYNLTPLNNFLGVLLLQGLSFICMYMCVYVFLYKYFSNLIWDFLRGRAFCLCRKVDHIYFPTRYIFLCDI